MYTDGYGQYELLLPGIQISLIYYNNQIEPKYLSALLLSNFTMKHTKVLNITLLRFLSVTTGRWNISLLSTSNGYIQNYENFRHCKASLSNWS